MAIQNIMVAANPSGIETIAYAIGPGFHVDYVTRLPQAIAQLSPKVELLICDVTFSDFQMPALLQAVSFLSRRPYVLCVHAGPVQLDPQTVSAWEMVSRRSGAVGFVDLGTLHAGDGMRLSGLMHQMLARPEQSDSLQLLQSLGRLGGGFGRGSH